MTLRLSPAPLGLRAKLARLVPLDRLAHKVIQLPVRPALPEHRAIALLGRLDRRAHRAKSDPQDRKAKSGLRDRRAMLARLDPPALRGIPARPDPRDRRARLAQLARPGLQARLAQLARPDLRAHRAILQRFPALPDPPAQLDRPAPKGQDRAMSLVRFPPLTTLSFGGMALRAN